MTFDSFRQARRAILKRQLVSFLRWLDRLDE